MTGLPKLTVVGTLTGDPEIRMLPSGVAVTTVTIAANERKYNKETGKYENASATFIRGSLWREYAEHLAESLRKGDNVIAIGELKQREYTAKDGSTKQSLELAIEEIGPTLRFVNAPTSRTGGGAPVTAGWGTTSTDEPSW